MGAALCDARCLAPSFPGGSACSSWNPGKSEPGAEPPLLLQRSLTQTQILMVNAATQHSRSCLCLWGPLSHMTEWGDSGPASGASSGLTGSTSYSTEAGF